MKKRGNRISDFLKIQKEEDTQDSENENNRGINRNGSIFLIPLRLHSRAFLSLD